MFNALPSQARLQELFTYEPLTGALVRKSAPPHLRKLLGKACENKSSGGYITVRVDRTLYAVHRLIWMHVYGVDPGDLQIDHIDGDPSNNRLTNLRLATNSQNQCNVIKKRDLPKGVYRWRKKFRAKIGNDHIGLFDSAEAAHDAYCREAFKRHGHFARTA